MTLDGLRREITALDKAEWTNWPHAYGKARDTPGYLVALLGDDHDAQYEAALHFSGAIVHQYSVWPASPDAFEWLIRVLRVKPLPATVLDECLGALAESAEYLRDVPSGARVPDLSRDARDWLTRYAKAPEDEQDVVWEEFFATDVNEEIAAWVSARMATLRPAVATLVTELADRAPEACEDLREAWLSG
jgi:hypothetical protein